MARFGLLSALCLLGIIIVGCSSGSGGSSGGVFDPPDVDPPDDESDTRKSATFTLQGQSGTSLGACFALGPPATASAGASVTLNSDEGGERTLGVYDAGDTAAVSQVFEQFETVSGLEYGCTYTLRLYATPVGGGSRVSIGENYCSTDSRGVTSPSDLTCSVTVEATVP